MLTEEIIKQFEKEDDDLDKAIGFWWSVYYKLREEQHKLHDDFRKEHGLPLQWNFITIADWRWKQKH